MKPFLLLILAVVAASATTAAAARPRILLDRIPAFMESLELPALRSPPPLDSAPFPMNDLLATRAGKEAMATLTSLLLQQQRTHATDAVL